MTFFSLLNTALSPLTATIGVFQWDDLVFAPVFKLPQSEAREFYLKSTVHQTCAGLQVPMKFQVTFVNELHSLKHK